MKDNRVIIAEALGTAFLVAAVVGSGIMAERLSGGNIGVALLANAIATGATLYVLVSLFGPVSGAQFNPVVSIWLSLGGRQNWSLSAVLSVAQIVGGITGCCIANIMFDLPALSLSNTVRGGAGQWVGEAIATFGLMLMIAGIGKNAPERLPAAVALFITAAYWFTSSTSFANPAVTIARMVFRQFRRHQPGECVALHSRTGFGAGGRIACRPFSVC
jgi:glycerol uptake facilitator-like aquaporin